MEIKSWRVETDFGEAASAPPRPQQDRPWVVTLTCCGRDAGVQRAATWEEVEAFRESWTSGPGVNPHGYSGGCGPGHQRSGVITKDGEAAPPRPEAPPQIICPRCGSDNQKRIADVWECPACNLEWNAASEAVRKYGLDAVYPPSPALPEAARYQAGQAWMRSRVADVLRGDHPDLAALVEKLPLHGEDTDARVRAALQEAARATKPLRDRELEAERIPTGFMEMRLDAARPEAPPGDRPRTLRESLTDFVQRERALREQKGGQTVGYQPTVTPSVLKELERMLRDTAADSRPSAGRSGDASARVEEQKEHDPGLLGNTASGDSERPTPVEAAGEALGEPFRFSGHWWQTAAPKRSLLEWLAGFCEQVANDGIIPDREWFAEVARDTRVEMERLKPRYRERPPFHIEAPENEARFNTVSRIDPIGQAGLAARDAESPYDLSQGKKGLRK